VCFSTVMKMFVVDLEYDDLFQYHFITLKLVVCILLRVLVQAYKTKTCSGY
jgi:hypothetical protein